MTNHQSYRPIEYDEEARDVLPIIPRQVERERGRAVPDIEEPKFEIVIDRKLLGTVYPMRLKGKAEYALERAVGILQIAKWMETYAGGDPAYIEEVLGELPLQEIAVFIRMVSQALMDSLALKNTNGPR